MSALRDVLAGRAAALGADGREVGGRTEFNRGEVVFAVLDGATLSARLESAIVAAALRTPDTAAAPRGPEWVAFTPATLDGPAIDQAVAWFEAAWRRAGG